MNIEDSRSQELKNPRTRELENSEWDRTTASAFALATADKPPSYSSGFMKNESGVGLGSAFVLRR
jgi:hypothetical protein